MRNPYEAFRRLEDHDTPVAEAGQQRESVLVLPIRVAPTSNLLEGLIGAGLKLDGYRVFALLDGGSLRYSENSSLGKSWIVANALSCYEQAEFCDAFGLEACYFDDLLDRRRLREIGDTLRASTFAELVAYEFEGVRIGFHAKSALMRYLRQETVELDENVGLMREFVTTGLKTALVVSEFLKRHPVRYAFLSHGIYATWGVATDVLVRAGVTVSVWGRGYVSGNFILARNKSYLLDGIAESMEDIDRSLEGRADQQERASAYFAAKANPKSQATLVSYYDERHEGAAKVTNSASQFRDGYDALVGVFPNIPWDGSIFCASEYTPTLRAFAEKIQMAAEAFPTVRFVIRCHPAEIGRASTSSRESFASFFQPSSLARLPNILVLEPLSTVSSYALFPQCDAALVFGTSMALELAVRGIPVIQTGLYDLSNKGIVFQVESDKELLHCLAEVRHDSFSMSADMKAKAARYADYHVNLRHVQDDMMTIRNYAFVDYKFSSRNMLGRDRLKSCAAIKAFVLGETNRCINPYA
jgi:hypothetical protein